MTMVVCRDTGPRRLATQLIGQLSETKELDAAGQPTFKVVGLVPPFSLLSQLVTFDPSLPEMERLRIAHEAAFEMARQDAFSLGAYLGCASRLEREYLSRPMRRFIVLAQLSVSSGDHLQGTRLRGLSVSFPLDVSKHFAKARAKAIDEPAKHHLYADPPKGYRWTRVSVRERCPAAAVAAADDCLQLQLGLWNLCLNRKKGMRWSTGPRQPVNEIGLGPIHTVHRPSGIVEDGVGWYDTGYFAPLAVKRLGDDAPSIHTFSKRMRRRLSRVAYRSAVEDCIRLYNRALDEHDASTSYLRMWQALESATNAVRDRHADPVRRAAFLYSDHEYAVSELGHLRDSRNRFVHAGESTQQVDANLLRLRFYVENLLMFHAARGAEFSSLKDVSEFLDLPRSATELSRRLKLVSKAAQWHGDTP
jgi:hypothetical protein